MKYGIRSGAAKRPDFLCNLPFHLGTVYQCGQTSVNLNNYFRSYQGRQAKEYYHRIKRICYRKI